MTPPLRISAEWLLRATTLAALGTVLWRWTHPAAAAAPRAEVVAAGADATALGAALRRWSAAPSGPAHVALDGAPAARERDWLRALAGAGMPVTWGIAAARPLAASAQAIADPVGGVRVEVADAEGAWAAVGDAFAAADTVRARGGRGAAVLPAPAPGDTLVARGGATTARLAVPAAPRIGAVLVLGRAGWEAKFVAAALEERGWPVRLRVSVAPGMSVTQGADADAPPDTATTAAVVVLDSGAVGAADAARLARFVRAGGGLVLAGDAAASAALRPLAAGGVGAPVPGVPGAVDGAAPRRGLTLLPVEPRSDALVLERRGAGAGAPAAGAPAAGAPAAVAARRVGAGRVAQVGYAETWRWRMSADDDAPAAHRAWWARVVSAVAYAPVAAGAGGARGARSGAVSDPAPLAATVAALGPPRAAPAGGRSGGPAGRVLGDGWLAAIAAAALLGEVASRRMRGAR